MNNREYYNHDPVWKARAEAGVPFWGSFSHHVYNGVIRYLKEFYGDKGTVIDIGCGAGAFGVKCIEAGYNYVGVDHSQIAIDFGKERFKDLELHQGDLVRQHDHPIFAKKYPIVTSLNVIHCLVENDDRLQFLNHLRSLMAPNGVCVITTMVLPSLPGFKVGNNPRHLASVNTVKKELFQAGFKEIVFERFLQARGRAKISNLYLVLR